MANIATASVLIVPSFKGIHKDTKQALGGLDPEFDQAGKRGGGALSRGVGKVAKAGLIAGGAALAAGLGTALVKGLSRLTAIDNAEQKLLGLGHSAKTVEQIMTNALNSVRGTAFGLDEAASVSAALVASGIKPGQDLERTLKTVADSATIAGIGMDEMGSIFGKVAAGGKLQADELNQLAERGVPALQLLSDHLGKSVEDTRKMVSEGKVSFEDFAAAMDAGMGGAALKSGETFTGAWKNVGAALGRIGATLLTPFFEAAKGGMGGLTAILDSINDALQPVMAAFGEWLNSIDWAAVGQQMGDIFTPLWEVLQPLIPALMEAWQKLSPIGIIFQALAPVAGVLAEAIGTVAGTLAGVLAEGLAFVLPILAELATTIAGVLANGIEAVLPIIVMLAQMLGPVLGVVMRTLAPIVLVIAQVFMDLVTALMPVTTIIMELVAALLPPLMGLFMALAPVIVMVGQIVAILARVIGAVLVKAVQILTPIIQFLANVLAVVLPIAINIVIGILNVIIGVVKWVGQAFTWLWANAIMPAWDGIKAAIQVAWGIIRPIFNLIVSIIKVSLMVAFKLLEILVKAVWMGIRIAIDAAWTFIKRWIFDPIVAFIRNVLGPAFQWFKTNVIDPVWNGIKSTIDTVWQWVKKYAFDPLMAAVEKHLPKAFERGKDAIGKAWDKLKEIAKSPVKFVVETVLNGGLIAAFNKIASTFKMDEIDDIKLPNGFRDGGKVWGAGTETSDSIPARLSRNEHVLTAKDVRNLGGHGNVYRLRDMARRGLVPSFAGGGTLMEAADWWIAKGARPSRHSRFNGGRRISSGHSKNSYHYRDLAVDFNYGPGGENATEKAFFDKWIGEFQRKFDGIRTIWRAPGHYNHLHIDTAKGANMGSSGGGGVSLDGFLGPFSGLFEKITSGIQNAGPWGDLIGGGAKKIVQMPIDWITDNASKFLDFIGDAADNFKEGTGRARGLAWAGAKGWPLNGDRWKALDFIVNKESSWNPNEKNPRSSASGLGQFIDANARHYLGSAPMRKHPFGKQLDAIVEYTSDRYGGLVPARRYWERNNHYKDGGAVRMPWASTYTGPTKYDNGGWLTPGLTTTLNATKKPEAVFTDQQFRIIKAAALNNAGGYSGPQMTFGDVHGHSAGEVAQEVFKLMRREEAVRGPR